MPLYFGVFVSLFAYLIGMELKKKFGWPVLNPLLIMRERPISAIF